VNEKHSKEKRTVGGWAKKHHNKNKRADKKEKLKERFWKKELGE